MNRPNLVIFVPDQWRAEASGYCGNKTIKTPHLDALAEEGIGFTQAYVQNPVCTPSRCSFMSGWYPHVRGHRTMHHMLGPDEPCLLKQLKQAGYYVWWGGKNDLVRLEDEKENCSERYMGPKNISAPAWNPYKPGDKHYYSFYRGRIPNESVPAAPNTYDDYVIDECIRFLKSSPPEPYCLYLALRAPHCPFEVEDPYFSMYDRKKLPGFPLNIDYASRPQTLSLLRERMGLDKLNEADFREILAVYYGMITKSDWNLGRLTSALREAGHWDRTALFAFSDHGEYGGSYGLVEKTENTFEDCLVRVPFVVKVPGTTSVGRSDALVEVLDFFATASELAQLPPSHTHFSRSLLPLIRKEKKEFRTAVFSEGGCLPSEEHTHIPPVDRSQVYWPRVSIQNEERIAHGKAVMIRTADWKYVKRMAEPDELYNLKEDPDEIRNLAEDPSCQNIKLKLQNRMLQWFLETGDIAPFELNKRFPHEKLNLT